MGLANKRYNSVDNPVTLIRERTVTGLYGNSDGTCKQMGYGRGLFVTAVEILQIRESLSNISVYWTVELFVL